MWVACCSSLLLPVRFISPSSLAPCPKKGQRRVLSRRFIFPPALLSSPLHHLACPQYAAITEKSTVNSTSILLPSRDKAFLLQSPVSLPSTLPPPPPPLLQIHPRYILARVGRFLSKSIRIEQRGRTEEEEEDVDRPTFRVSSCSLGGKLCPPFHSRNRCRFHAG